MFTYDCIIVGAGMSGLSTAYALHHRGAKIVLIESKSTIGGALCSENTNTGFVLEHGTQTVSSDAPALWKHFEDIGIAQDRIVASSQRVYLPRQGVLEPLSLSPGALVQSRLLSPQAKLRMLAEPLLPRTPTSDESIGSFFKRRLGPEFTRTIIEPFVSGVYGGNMDELSVHALFPALWEMEQRHGSLVGGMLASNKHNHTETTSSAKRETFSFRKGLATWPQALAEQVGWEHIWCNTHITKLAPANQSWYVTVMRNGHEEVIHATRVVLAIPAHSVAPLLAELEPMTTHYLKAIRYPPLAVIHMVYQRDQVSHPLDGFGMLCPADEQCKLLGTLWMSRIFAERAPDGMVLASSFLGGARNPELTVQSDEALIARAKQEQRNLMGISGETVFTRIVRWQHSIPQYDASHAACLAACNRLEARWPGLYLLGSYRNGFSVEACWQKGMELGHHMVLAQNPTHLEHSVCTTQAKEKEAAASVSL